MNYAFIDPKERHAMASENSDFEFLVPTGFEWDEQKSKANLIKHGIDFEDASEVFYWPVVVRGSNRNSEERWIAIGKSHTKRYFTSFAAWPAVLTGQTSTSRPFRACTS